MAKILFNGFGNSELRIEPFDFLPDISPDIQQTLARLMGFHDGTTQFKLLRVDVDGRVLVSTSPTQTATATQSNAAALDTTGAVLLAANPSRRQYIIQNVGSDTLLLNFGNALNAAVAIEVLPEGYFADDVYTGTIFGAAQTTTTDVRVVEM